MIDPVESTETIMFNEGWTWHGYCSLTGALREMTYAMDSPFDQNRGVISYQGMIVEVTGTLDLARSFIHFETIQQIVGRSILLLFFEGGRRLAMAERIESKGVFFLVGLGIGSLVGILFAPKSGDETREYLKQKAKEGSEYTQKKARELRERAEDLVDRGNQVVTRKQEQIATAIDAGREAYQREKSKAHVA
jgi:gas vesicle protein